MEYNITYRRKDKGWQYIITIKKDGRWTHAGSKQGFSTRALAKVAAEKRVDEMKENYEIQKATLPEHQQLTFEAFADIYVAHKKLYNEENSILSLKTTISHFSKLNDMQITDIGPYNIQACVDAMVSKMAPSTIKKNLNIIKSLFSSAINQYSIISKNPVDKIRIPDDKRAKKEKALTKAQLEGLLSKITNRKYYIATLIASKCGLRVGEIAGLTWDRVDTKKAQIVVNRQWKLLKTGKWGFGTVKSENSNRAVPAPPIVLAELEKFKKEYPIHISNRLLPYKYSSNLSKALCEYYTKIGYPNTTIHDLRHTYGTMLVANGVDFKTVASLMGHDVKQTLDIYSHVTDDMIKSATSVINSIF